MLTIPELGWHGVKQLNSFHSQSGSPSPSNSCLGSLGHFCWNSLPACPDAHISEGYAVALYHPLGDLPDKDDKVSFSSSFLAVEVESSQLIPVAEMGKPGVTDSGNKALLNLLDLVDLLLVVRRPVP